MPLLQCSLRYLKGYLQIPGRNWRFQWLEKRVENRAVGILLEHRLYPSRHRILFPKNPRGRVQLCRITYCLNQNSQGGLNQQLEETNKQQQKNHDQDTIILLQYYGNENSVAYDFNNNNILLFILCILYKIVIRA